jgi:hypothetical protein
MQVLLIINNETITAYKDILNNIIKSLQQKGCTVFYYNKSRLKSLRGKVKFYTRNRNIKCDIVLVFNNQGISIVRFLFHNNKLPPVVHFALSNSINNQIEIFPSLYKVYKTVCYVNTDGIPKEMIGIYKLSLLKQSHTNSNNFSLYDKNKCTIFHKVSEGDSELRVVKSLIYSFNTLPQKFDLKIMCSMKQRSLLSSYSNFNTRFMNLMSNTEDHIIDADIILGSEWLALIGISKLKPTIIVGKFGYGGMVTPENIYEFIKNDFIGRPGGSEYEKIPISLLTQEIINVYYSRNLMATLDKNYKAIMKKFSLRKKEDSLINDFRKIISLDKFVNNINKFMKLRPKLASNIVIYKTNSDKWIVAKILISKILATIGKKEYRIIKDLNGKKNLETIYKSNCSSLSREEFATFLKELWNEKIIFFNEV